MGLAGGESEGFVIVATTDCPYVQATSSGLSKRLKRCRGRWKASSPRWPCTISGRIFHGIGVCRDSILYSISDLSAKLWSTDDPASGFALKYVNNGLSFCFFACDVTGAP